MDIFTTMITPFTADGRVDLDSAEKYVDWYFESGIKKQTPRKEKFFPSRSVKAAVF